ncbi:MAG TPA: DUF2752 domain-containing protein [bacterium]|nr:DUF2752 domain-containing protein [bacterium]HOL50001.1 DUF2752 domain-containing protein [bacterium]HPO51586.1 DUF2752 domain-containing protein [bacterium]
MSKNRIAEFLALGCPAARVIVMSAGMIFLACVNLESLRIPDLCIWEKIFGYCPAHGTTRALSAFFHGRFCEATRHNLNVLFIVPTLAGIILTDVVRLIKRNLEKI